MKTIEQSLRIIGAHIYVAYRPTQRFTKKIILLADNRAQAVALAEEYFASSVIQVLPVERTANARIYEL